MEKTKEELFEYAIKMFQRGETYRSILGYIKSNTSDEDVIKQIITSLDSLEKENKIKRTNVKESNSFINIFMGIFLIISGIALTYLLWGEGFIAVFPFLLIIAGLFAVYNKDITWLTKLLKRE
ncbi:MAG: hypothetical protein LBT27_09700 [Prevotellaceae bacterium]|jgi:Flp pilus assembly protein TadB|nr:hypothetical protein [Prevotellaceae bacterium]